MTPTRLRTLRMLVGVAAIVAPALHSLTDAMEWLHGGFSPLQLGLNYIAFVPMGWLLLGLYMAPPKDPGLPALIGALMYGAAFTYFAHTALLALATEAPDYASLWHRLGSVYTAHGALMVLGGLIFAGSALHSGAWPRWTSGWFAAGLLLHLLLALLGGPEVLQMAGSTMRNAGLIGMGIATLRMAGTCAA